MSVSKGNEHNKDLLVFARETKAKFTDLVENEIKLKSVKVSFGLKIRSSIESNSETQHMEQNFQENELHIFNRSDEELIKTTIKQIYSKNKGQN